MVLHKGLSFTRPINSQLLLLIHVCFFFHSSDENVDYTVLQTVNKWLKAINMDQYTDNFLDKGFSTPRQILQLTEEDLEALGIVPVGHRKKIFKAIKNTKYQVFVSNLFLKDIPFSSLQSCYIFLYNV